MMSLQFLALEALGDTEDVVPQVENVLFDVNLALKEINEEIDSKQKLYNETKSKLVKSRAPEWDMTEYHFYVDLISAALFDTFIYKILETPTHIAWKEYFHAMYESCVITTDDTVCWQILINTCFQNFDLFKVPEMPPQDDRYFRLILYIRDLFDHLKGLHQTFMVSDFSKKLCENMEHDYKIRCEMLELTNNLKDLKKMQRRYTRMLIKQDQSSSI